MYSEAQLRIDDPSDRSAVAKGLRVLNSLAKVLHQKRVDAGALMLASSEAGLCTTRINSWLQVRFNLEGDDRDPIDVELKQMYETNSMVEVWKCSVSRRDARRSSCCWPMLRWLSKSLTSSRCVRCCAATPSHHHPTSSRSCKWLEQYQR